MVATRPDKVLLNIDAALRSTLPRKVTTEFMLWLHFRKSKTIDDDKEYTEASINGFPE